VPARDRHQLIFWRTDRRAEHRFLQSALRYLSDELVGKHDRQMPLARLVENFRESETGEVLKFVDVERVVIPRIFRGVRPGFGPLRELQDA
jgi:hypothetical protein